MTKEPTIQDVLDAMHVFSTHVDVQLAELKQDVSGLKQDVSVLKQDVLVLKHDMSAMKTDLRDVRATMVTKDYMEGRLAAFAR